MRKIFLALVFSFVAVEATIAQQDAQYTQYMYNPISVNSAYAGNRGVLSMTALYRTQWVGLEGAPKTQTFNIHSPVGKKVGLGLSVVNDEICNGTSQETYFDIVASYSIKVSDEAQFSFGIKGGGHLLNLDFTKLQGYTEEQGTSSLANIDNKFSPNFGAGIYYHTQKFYFGVSIPNFLETKHFENTVGVSSQFLGTERVNLYFISGYVFDLNSNLKFKPAFLFKAVKGAPLQADVSANFLINNKFSLGAAYRWDSAFSALAGFQMTDSFMLGLAYDREITELGNTSFNDGSFEVFLRYELFNNENKVLTPRFF